MSEEETEKVDPGFDLDKLEVPRVSREAAATPGSNPPADADVEADKTDTEADSHASGKAEEKEAGTGGEGARKKEPIPKHVVSPTDSKPMMFFLAAFLGLAVVMVSFLLWHHTNDMSPLKNDTKALNPTDATVSIGPITTNAGETGRVISMTLNVVCKDSESKRRTSNMASVIKDRIVISMSSSAAAELVGRKDFEALKSFLLAEINQVLEKNSIEKTHLDFSEFSIS